MAIGCLRELQEWVKQRQQRKTVGILSERDVKMFWEAQEILENSVSKSPDVEAFLYIKPMSTWSEYDNDTSYKGPCQILRWWSSGGYRCERENPEQKSRHKLNADDTKAEFWGMLTSNVENSAELLDSTVKCWELAAKFDARFRSEPNDKKEVVVFFERKPETE